MYAENNGVKIWYEIHGQGDPTLVMVHGFQIAPSKLYKRSFVPFLSRHMRVITLDLRGAGQSDHPDYGYDMNTCADDIHSVVEAAGLDRFAMAGLSCGVPYIIQYNASYPGRASHLILLNGYARMIRADDYPQGLPKATLDAVLDGWQAQPEAMLKGFIAEICSEKYSLRDRELLWEWAHETSERCWQKGYRCTVESNVENHLEGIDIPVLIIHSGKDRVVYPSASNFLHEKISGSTFVSIPGAGHGFVHTWPQVGRHIFDFLKPKRRKPIIRRDPKSPQKVLWISSPIGLGHVKRDLAIVHEMRKTIPDLIVHWLCADPVRSFLEGMNEQIHPLSEALWDEGGQFESHGKEYALDAVEAYWDMDTLLNTNFMVFADAVRKEEYDLVVGDESWEVDQYLHYNSSLKTTPFIFITDFVGVADVSNDKRKQAHVYNVNGVWVEMREVHPEGSDLSIFVGEPEDIPDKPFGHDLPNRRAWARERFSFSGYVLPFDPAGYADPDTIRAELGFSPDDKVLVVAVGGTSLGRPLMDKCVESLPIIREKVPGIRTVFLCGPRIAPESFSPAQDVVFQPLVQDAAKFYAACDLAVIQGGLSTSMELTALGRPFIYFPLNEHFEQQHFVGYRLDRYHAGVRMDFSATTPAQLADAVAANMNASISYAPVRTDGAKNAAAMILGVLERGGQP